MTPAPPGWPLHEVIARAYGQQVAGATSPLPARANPILRGQRRRRSRSTSAPASRRRTRSSPPRSYRFWPATRRRCD